MNYVILALDSIAAVIAVRSIAPLWAVSALVRSRGLKQAWRTLTAIIVGCIALLSIHATATYGVPPSVADLAGVGIFLLGASFACALAVLSERTARHTLRVEDLAQAAYLDALTGIGNVRRFSEALSVAVVDAGLRGLPLSVITLDIDHFKRVNDTHGHAAGDEVLKQVAATLTSSVRRTDTACRVGGEEFAVIVPSLHPDHVMALAERIHAAVAALRIETGLGRPLRVTASVGFASLAAGETGPGLLKRADAALYAAKRDGRDRVRLAA